MKLIRLKYLMVGETPLTQRSLPRSKKEPILLLVILTRFQRLTTPLCNLLLTLLSLIWFVNCTKRRWPITRIRKVSLIRKTLIRNLTRLTFLMMTICKIMSSTSSNRSTTSGTNARRNKRPCRTISKWSLKKSSKNVQGSNTKRCPISSCYTKTVVRTKLLRKTKNWLK